MKKSVVILLALGLVVSACSTYTCPTYTKAPVKKEKAASAEQKI